MNERHAYGKDVGRKEGFFNQHITDRQRRREQAKRENQSRGHYDHSEAPHGSRCLASSTSTKGMIDYELRTIGVGVRQGLELHERLPLTTIDMIMKNKI
jgi:hypothetical protein